MFDQNHRARKKIAIVGGGISGLSAAYYLAADNDVTIYEAEPRLGGHARTVMAGKNGNQPVDTGFIVFNYVTYPNLTKLFKELDVPVTKSFMSFAASIDDGWLEYGLNNLATIAAQKRNLLRPQFIKMIADIIKFGKHAENTADSNDKTIGELIDELKLGSWFRDYYMMPMCGAIWSTPVDNVDQFPAKSLVQFFRNHALLAGQKEHQWWTVKGGSIEYVKRLEAKLRERGCKIELSAPVLGIKRDATGVSIRAAGTELAHYDDVIFACHSDQALRILGNDATTSEKSALGSIRYQNNTAVLHCDPAQMPKRKACWSSWAYRSQAGAIGVTYWMNKLQDIPEEDQLFVTLNPSSEIPSHLVYDQVEYSHPIFDGAALKAQQDILAMQGTNHTWFVGAYNRHGFHEDGIASAMRVVRLINEEHQLKGSQNALYDQGAEIAIPVNM